MSDRVEDWEDDGHVCQECVNKDAEIERLTHRDIARGDTVMSLLEERERLWAEKDKLQAVVDALKKVHGWETISEDVNIALAALETDDE